MGSMSQQLSTPDCRNEADRRPRPATRARGLGAEGRDILARTVERDVIPALVAMPWTAPSPQAPSGPAIDAMMVEELLGLCLQAEGQGAASFIAALHGQGASAESLYTMLLTPVARRLGDLWVDDDANFAEVTLGVLRLQNAQRMLTPGFIGTAVPAPGAPRALLLPVPGEQHTFGLSMVVDFFVRAGWDARSDIVPTEAAAIEMVRHERADLIGLSFACDERIETAARLIAEFRRVTPNRNLVVLVGGPSFVADPALAARVGADGTAADGHQAVLAAHHLVHVQHRMAGPV